MILRFILDRLGVPAGVHRYGVILLTGAAAYYLASAPGALSLFAQPGAWLVKPAVWPILVLVGVAALGLETLEWQGPIPLKSANGYAWARSIRARLAGLPVGALCAAGVLVLLDPLQVLWFDADWGRFAVLLLVVLELFVRAAVAVFSALAPGRLLALEPAGVWTDGRFTAFDDIRQVRIEGDLRQRQAMLVTDAGDRRLRLDQVGVSARTFVALLGELAPGLPVAWPRQAAAFA